MRSVLITGGSGTLGRALARRFLSAGVERICVFSRGEHRQADMKRELGDDERLRWFIGDVRDRDRLRRAMDGVDVVVHAAALKRVEVGEYNPGEMVKTNVNGAVNVVEAALDAGVAKVVAISSDKACEPLNAYGKSKALAEHIFLAANNARGARGARFAVARYGNVAGSAGSVIPIWRNLLELGSKTAPVTDPECTRFWMTADEACDLVLWAIENAEGGELIVPSLPAYRLGDLAAAMGLEPDVIGLGQGEKRHETMIAAGEAGRFTLHGGRWVAGREGRAVREGALSSDSARRMSVEEIRVRLESV